MGCVCTKPKQIPGYEEPTVLAAEMPFTVGEVEALYELFKKLSSSIIDDELIHKEEFQLALLKSRRKKNLFADRIFDLFDVKRNGVIEFGEFVCSLGIFHLDAPVPVKIECPLSETRDLSFRFPSFAARSEFEDSEMSD